MTSVAELFTARKTLLQRQAVRTAERCETRFEAKWTAVARVKLWERGTCEACGKIQVTPIGRFLKETDPSGALRLARVETFAAHRHLPEVIDFLNTSIPFCLNCFDLADGIDGQTPTTGEKA
jgi:hypothetical protein